jgi:hypothetical protein
VRKQRRENTVRGSTVSSEIKRKSMSFVVPYVLPGLLLRLDAAIVTRVLLYIFLVLLQVL